MIEKSAEGVRGTILFVGMQDSKPVFRVYGEPDPNTGRRSHTDYAIRAEDLRVEVTSGYYQLYEPEPGEEGGACIDYRRERRTGD